MNLTPFHQNLELAIWDDVEKKNILLKTPKKGIVMLNHEESFSKRLLQWWIQVSACRICYAVSLRFSSRRSKIHDPKPFPDRNYLKLVLYQKRLVNECSQGDFFPIFASSYIKLMYSTEQKSEVVHNLYLFWFREVKLSNVLKLTWALLVNFSSYSTSSIWPFSEECLLNHWTIHSTFI